MIYIQILAALIATATALVIAFVAYPWQKQKDRELRVEEEKRAVFREYLKQIDLIVSQRLFDNPQSKIEAYSKCKAALNEVLIFAKPATADAMWDLYASASNLANGLDEAKPNEQTNREQLLIAKKEADKSFERAISAARSELGLEGLATSVQIMLLASIKAGETSK